MEIHKLISRFNFSNVSNRKIKYIVIHYTGGVASAENNVKYFSAGNRGASAHYFVGHNGEIWQSVEDKNAAWHCGSKSGYKHPECRNANSIGIEMCCKTKGDPQRADNMWYFEDATVNSTIELTKSLMKKYSIPANNVLRHFDVTGKVCPAPYVYNNGKHTWDAFKASLIAESGAKEEMEVANYDEIVWDFLSGKGLNSFAVAGVMGNLQVESRINPHNIQNSFEKKLGLTDDTYTAAVDSGAYSRDAFIKDGAGYGLAQWTYKTRKAGLYDYAKEHKTSIGDINTQLDYLWIEFKDRVKMLAELSASKSVLEASNIILHQFEKPANQSADVEKYRAGLGQEFYNKFAQKGEPVVKKEKKEIVTVDEPVKEEVKVEEPVEEIEALGEPPLADPAEDAEEIEALGEPPLEMEEYKVKVEISDLNIRKGPGINFEKTGKFTGVGVFTIVEEKDGWGKLKSGAGWIKLSFAKRI